MPSCSGDRPASAPERTPAIIEKDFWVCWAHASPFRRVAIPAAVVIFKGGTSLSKAYHAVERFSEDVDLSLSRRDLGFADDRDPEQPGISGKESRRRIEALVARRNRLDVGNGTAEDADPEAGVNGKRCRQSRQGRGFAARAGIVALYTRKGDE